MSILSEIVAWDRTTMNILWKITGGDHTACSADSVKIFPGASYKCGIWIYRLFIHATYTCCLYNRMSLNGQLRVTPRSFLPPHAVFCPYRHWNGNGVMLTTFSSVAALEVVKLTTSSALSEWVFKFNGLSRTSGGRLNKKDGLTRYGDSHVKDKTS